MTKAKNRLAFIRQDASGQTCITVYRDALHKPIEQLIDDCVAPKQYMTVELADRARARYTEMRDAGVRAVLKSMPNAPRVLFDYGHYRTAESAPISYRAARFVLGTRQADLHRDYKFLRQLERDLGRVDKHLTWNNPAVLLLALSQLGAQEVFDYQGELVVFAREKGPVAE